MTWVRALISSKMGVLFTVKGKSPKAPHIGRAHHVPEIIDLGQPTPSYILVKLLNFKEKGKIL